MSFDFDDKSIFGLDCGNLLAFLAVVVWYVAVKTRPLSEKQQATLDKINQYARENLTGLRVIRAFAREDFQERSSLLKMLSMRIIQINF
ncbi:MAG: ABC transporter transmembrane domain-containing protein [Streptococcus salivarius]